MSILLKLTDNEHRVLALWACRQSVKETARCLALTARQVQYYRCSLRLKLGASKLADAATFIQQLADYDALTLMGQHLMVAYEMMRVQQRLAISQSI